MKTKLAVLILIVGMVTNLHAQTKIVFSPQWTAQAQFAGFYVADAKGFYKEAGLDVSIEHHSLSTPNINLLRNGKSQFITLHLLSAMKYRDEGIRLVNVMQHFQQNTQMIVSHKPLKGIESLRGLKLGHWKAGFSELAFALNEKEHLDIQFVPFISHVNLFISGAIDATLAMNFNEFFQLKIAGQRITKEQTLYFRDIGYDIPMDGIYTTPEYYAAHKQTVDQFTAATRKGWEWAVEHPEEALDIVMVYAKDNHSSTNLLSQRWMLQECLSVLKDKKTGKRNYTLKPEAFKLANDILLEGKVIKEKINYNQFVRP